MGKGSPETRDSQLNQLVLFWSAVRPKDTTGKACCYGAVETSSGEFVNYDASSSSYPK